MSLNDNGGVEDDRELPDSRGWRIAEMAVAARSRHTGRVADDEISELAGQIADADGPPHPVELPDEPNPAAGLLGMLLYPLLPWRPRRQRR